MLSGDERYCLYNLKDGTEKVFKIYKGVVVSDDDEFMYFNQQEHKTLKFITLEEKEIIYNHFPNIRFKAKQKPKPIVYKPKKNYDPNEVVRLCNKGMLQKDVAAMFGIASSTVSKVMNGWS